MKLQLVLIFFLWLITCIVAGYGEALRIKDRIKYDKEWHNLQWLERIGIGTTLFYLGIALKTVMWELIPIVLLLCVLFFIIYDGLINVIAFNRNWFYVSQTTSAWTEKFAHWWIKIPLIIILFVINILTFKKLKEKTL